MGMSRSLKCQFALTFSLVAASFLVVGEACSQSAQNEPEAKPVPGDTTEVTVTAHRKDVSRKIDRDIYDVKVGPDAPSLTTADVIIRLPGVMMDSSSNVTVHGGEAVSFLIDGKPVKRDLALSIPASQIAQVEVITNPSAEFASSSGAIINIVLKKNAALGWKGAVSAKVDTLGGFDAGLNFTHGGVKWNFIGSVTLRKIPFRTTTDRQTRYDQVQDGLYDRQDITSRERSAFQQLTLQSKLIRNFTDDKSLSIIFGVHANQYPKRIAYDEALTEAGYSQSNIYNKSVRFNGLYPYGSVSYEAKKQDDYRLASYLQYYSGVDSDGEDVTGAISRNTHEHTSFNFIQQSMDFDKNLNKTNVLSGGFSVSGNKVDQLTTLTGYSAEGQTDNGVFRFDRTSYAAYATYQTKAVGVDVKLGVRFERFDQNLDNALGHISGLRSVTNVLPTLHLSKTLDAHNTLRASFTRRTEAPDAINYNPFRKYDSPYFAEQGNPFLKPASKNQAEFSHTYEKEPFSFVETVYYRDTKNDVNSYTFLGGDGVTVLSYTNLGSSKAYGYNATLKTTIAKKLDISYDIDLFHKEILAPQSLIQYQAAIYNSFNSDLNLDYSASKSDQYSVSISYAGRSYGLGIVNPPTWSSDLKYIHTFKSKVALSVELINLAVPQTLTTRFLSPGLSGFERTYQASQLFRLGLSKSF